MRTRNSLFNFVSSFFPWVILAILGFIKIKLFIYYFGAELNGLIQLSHQIFAFLTISSMGFGSAIIYSLYKPLSNKDFKKVSELFVGSRKIFRIIGIIIFIGGLIAAIITPFVIYNLQISKIYVFLILLLYAIDYLSMYFMVAPYKVLLEADQKTYKTNIIINSRHFIFRLIELVLIINRVDILLIIIGSIIANFIANLFIIKIVRKDYTLLNKKAIPDTTPLNMTKDVFVHRINNVVFNNVDIILLSLTQGLVIVSIYGAYNYIVQFLRQSVAFIFRAPQASFGNLFINKEKKGIEKFKIFNEYLSLSFYLSLILIPIFVVSVASFVEIWINQNFVLSFTVIIFFGIILWYEFMLAPLITVVESNGMFKNTKRIVLISSIINMLISIILVKFLGILGVLIGTVVSYAFVNHIMYVRYVYKNILGQKIILYYRKYIIFIIFLILSILFNKFIIDFLSLYYESNLITWVVHTLLIGVIQFLFITILFMVFYKSFRKLFSRLLFQIRKQDRKILNYNK